MTLVDLHTVHKARALIPVQVMTADGVKSGLPGKNLYGFAARETAEAVAVGHHHGAAALDQLREIRIIDFGAGQHHADTERELGFRLSLFHLGERFLQIRQDQVMRADLADQLDHMEFIAGDRRVFKLPEFPDGRDRLRQFVKLCDGFAHRFFRNIHTERVLHRIQDVLLNLRLVILQIGFVTLHGRINDGDKEVLMFDGVQEIELFLHTLHCRAAFRAE